MSARCCIFAVLIGADAAVSLRLAQPGLRAPRLASPLRMMSGDDFYFGESDVKVSASTTEAVEEEERELTEKEKEIARLRAAEVFMRKENGDASCTVCGYKYKMATGAGMTAPPSTPFDLLGDSWTCPQCKSPKAFFTPDTIEIAGFEDNQSYGFGTNTWTESQKSNAIFGGLFFFFLLLLSGYALN